ncbi:MAG: hypothetical protein ACI92E_002075 [Oceanicoccus sp.]|jgi:hypothetical protein
MKTADLSAEHIVNTSLYPIYDKKNPVRKTIIEKCKSDLEEHLYCVLPDFIKPEALQSMKSEAIKLRPLANDNISRRNCYLQRSIDPSLPKEHARNHQNPASTRMISYNLLQQKSPLKSFYHSSAVREMVAEIVGDAPLFHNEDLYQPANYVCYENGDQSSWHFDSVNAFTMTLMVQPAASGGEFEISPNTRSDIDQNYDHVASVLKGDRDDTIVSVGRQPGALCLFRGCNSLHRVSPVVGDTMRIMGVFVYETEPGVIGDPEVNETIYGVSHSPDS